VASRQIKMSNITRHTYAGKETWGDPALTSKHREHHICFECGKFHPGSPLHCSVAAVHYEFCVRHRLVAPIYACASFEYLNSNEAN